VGVPVCFPRESRHLALVCVADRWGKASLLARVALITDGNKSLTALGLPDTISCMVYEWSPLRLSPWYKLQSSELWFLHLALSSSSLRRNNSISPCLLHACRSKPSGQRKMASGDDHGKHPCDESSSRSGGWPPPHRMTVAVGAHWTHAIGR
jgi:hypothetical protein